MFLPAVGPGEMRSPVSCFGKSVSGRAFDFKCTVTTDVGRCSRGRRVDMKVNMRPEVKGLPSASNTFPLTGCRGPKTGCPPPRHSQLERVPGQQQETRSLSAVQHYDTVNEKCASSLLLAYFVSVRIGK